MGSSAGLNLIADELPFVWSNEAGTPIVERVPAVRGRTGYDVLPLDLAQHATRTWLQACLWPGQNARAARLEAAFRAWDSLHARGNAPQVLAAEAADVPPRLPRQTARVVLVYQTLVRDYLAPEQAAAYRCGMEAWLSACRGPALWLELEVTGDEAPPERSAALVARLRNVEGDRVDLELARTHPHPSVLHVDQEQVDRLTRAFDTA